MRVQKIKQNNMNYPSIRSGNTNYMPNISKTFNIPRIQQTNERKTNKVKTLENN